MTFQETPTQKVLSAFADLLTKNVAEHVYKAEPARGFPIPAIYLLKSSGPRFSQEAALGEDVDFGVQGNYIHVFIQPNVYTRKPEDRDTLMDKMINTIAKARTSGFFDDYGIIDLEIYLSPRDKPYDEKEGLYCSIIDYHVIYLLTRVAKT